MSNPLASKVTIPFRGRSYTAPLDLRGILAAEMDLNMSIISPTNETPFAERPLMVQMVAYLYAILSNVPNLKPTVDECREALAGPKATFIMQAINGAYPSLEAQLTEYAKQFRGGDEQRPLAAEHGGTTNGPTPESGLESPAPSSGN